MEGRFDEGISHAKRGIELDPLTPFNAYNLGWCLYFARRFDESIAQYRRVIAAHPLYPLAHYGLSWTLRYLGEHQEALSEAKRSVELSNESPMILFLYGQAQAAAGLRREAEEMVARLTAIAAERHVSFYNVALIHCFLGEREKAFECLERAYAERDAWLVWLGVEPMFDNLRDDARFSALLQKTNNPAAAPAEIAGPCRPT